MFLLFLGSYGKYAIKIRNWKVPKFLRKTDDIRLDEANKDQSDKENIVMDGLIVSSPNGYQQVPIVIETSETDVTKPVDSLNPNKLSVDVCSQRNSTASAYESDILDIKSYISQSRSDVSPFARSSSYRSQYGRTTNCEVRSSQCRMDFVV